MAHGFISIDPGLNECGFAYFDGDNELIDCGLIVNSLGLEYRSDRRIQSMAWEVYEGLRFFPADRLYIEKMFVRRNKPAAFENLIVLSTIAGAIAGMNELTSPSRRFRYVLSNDWTDGRNKTQNHPRIRGRLSNVETGVLGFGLKDTPKTNHKEVLDAVGIGLYVANRL